MSYRSRDAANEYPCPNCATPVYWRDGPYCSTCRDLVIRSCPACNATSQTDRGRCLACDTALPRGPIFGLDRIPDPKRRWVTRDPAVLAETAYVRWINGAKGDPSIRLATCDGCGEPFGYSTDKRSVLNPTYAMSESAARDRERQDHGVAQYRIFLPADTTHWYGNSEARWTYGGKAHRRCIDKEGRLIKTATAAPWPGYTPEAQAYEIATR